jgi:NAD(P)-dependent dehydrogenase (short-subunit alcohol dehydrogenase family)
MPSIVYLVSGANRGIGGCYFLFLLAIPDDFDERIGLELVKTLLARPNIVVFAGARDPSKATDLQTLEKEHPGKLHVVKLTSTNEAENKAVAEHIKTIAGRLDVVIANAGNISALSYRTRYTELNSLGTGIAKDHELGLTVPLASLREHFEVNTLGPLALFQATYPLLRVSTASPKFIPVSSLAGSLEIGTKAPLQKLAYGTSKAALNFLTRKLRMENDGLGVFLSLNLLLC